MSKLLTVRHTVNAFFDIPEDVAKILLSVKDNFKKENFGKTGSWYVKWCIFHYIDENGEEQEIEHIEDSVEMKHPDDEDDAYNFHDS